MEAEIQGDGEENRDKSLKRSKLEGALEDTSFLVPSDPASDGEQAAPGPSLWAGGWLSRGDTGHLDICQPLMKEFNLVENLKQPCLTGRLTAFNSQGAACVCRSGSGGEGEIKK